ncbi:Hypothetical protein FKW44_006619 [Caligus rogercresseyi]|uniref:Uncharacterized protein n=1 Tax=Caligus rogercresseyi TaxID=217165 RepID=A0A7T8QT09_CALRO|nr:Hypothetical protein FKW44_006619 [Caligus rogercresseyi]
MASKENGKDIRKWRENTHYFRSRGAQIENLNEEEEKMMYRTPSENKNEEPRPNTSTNVPESSQKEPEPSTKNETFTEGTRSFRESPRGSEYKGREEHTKKEGPESPEASRQ